MGCWILGRNKMGDVLVPALLSRAEFLTLTHQFDNAKTDINSVENIVDRADLLHTSLTII